jgi:hypothetical protein
MMSDGAHAIGELSGIGCHIFAAGILVAFIDLKELVAERSKVCRLPVGVRKSFTFVDGAVICRPAPPSDGSLSGDSSTMQLTNCSAVGQQLLAIVRAGFEHEALRDEFRSRFDREI